MGASTGLCLPLVVDSGLVEVCVDSVKEVVEAVVPANSMKTLACTCVADGLLEQVAGVTVSAK